MKVVALSSGLSEGSTTTRLVEGIAHAVPGASVQVIEMRPYAAEIAHALTSGFPSPRLQEVFDAVEAADALVAGAPVYNAMPSGLFVEFFNVLPEGVLEGKPMAIAATGGSPRHSLVTEMGMRPMFVYLHARLAATAVYAATEDWGAHGVGYTGDDGAVLRRRMTRAGRELGDLLALGSASVSMAEAEHAERDAGAPGSAVNREEPARAMSAEEQAISEYPDFVPFDALRSG